MAISILKKVVKKGRPKKQIKYTKTINVRLTQHQWVQVLNWAQKANLDPSVYIRKVLLDFLNIEHEITFSKNPVKVSHRSARKGILNIL